MAVAYPDVASTVPRYSQLLRLGDRTSRFGYLMAGPSTGEARHAGGREASACPTEPDERASHRTSMETPIRRACDDVGRANRDGSEFFQRKGMCIRPGMVHGCHVTVASEVVRAIAG